MKRYVPGFEKCWQTHERPVGDSWRVDGTTIASLGTKFVFVLKRHMRYPCLLRKNISRSISSSR
jgi:hypothetical protein